jgi:hypothetical protein
MAKITGITPTMIKLVGLLFAGFGVTLSLNVIWIYLRAGKLSGEILNVHQNRNLAINLPYSRVFDLCLESIKQNPEASIKFSDPEKGNVIAFYPLPAWSKMDGISPYSEDKLSIDVKEIRNNHIHVHVSCEPNVSFSIIDGRFDGGRNFKNIEKVVTFLKNRQIPDLVFLYKEDEKCPVCGHK